MNAITTPDPIRLLDRALVRTGSLFGGILILDFATQDNLPLLFAGLAVAAGALAWILWSCRGANAAPRPAHGRYAMGIGGSSLIYAAGTALIGAHLLTWDTIVLAAMLTMTPAFLAAHSITKLAR